jgi:hypothetical protein
MVQYSGVVEAGRGEEKLNRRTVPSAGALLSSEPQALAATPLSHQTDNRLAVQEQLRWPTPISAS